MRTFYNRFRHWIFAVILFPVGGCVTSRGVDRYFDKHPDRRAKVVEAGIRVDTFRKTEYTPGPTYFVNCDSIIAAGKGKDGTINTPSNRVPVNCPPSKNSVEVRNVRNLVEEDRLRALATKETKRADLSEQSDKSHRSQRNWLALGVAVYLLLRIGRSYLSKIPVIGWLSKLV